MMIIALLATRARPAEAGKGGMRVVAPFTVTDADGRALFAVTAHPESGGGLAATYDGEGHMVVAMTSVFTKGEIVTYSGRTNQLLVTIGAGTKGGEIEIYSSKERLLFRRPRPK